MVLSLVWCHYCIFKSSIHGCLEQVWEGFRVQSVHLPACTLQPCFLSPLKSRKKHVHALKSQTFRLEFCSDGAKYFTDINCISFVPISLSLQLFWVFHDGKGFTQCVIFLTCIFKHLEQKVLQYIYTQVLTLNVPSAHFKSTSSMFDLQNSPLSPNESKSENPYDDRGRHNNTEPVWIVMVATWYQTVCRTELNFSSVLIWERGEIWVSLGKHPWQPPACETRPFLPFFVPPLFP